jgi:hypothetical protein
LFEKYDINLCNIFFGSNEIICEVLFANFEGMSPCMFELIRDIFGFIHRSFRKNKKIHVACHTLKHLNVFLTI